MEKRTIRIYCSFADDVADERSTFPGVMNRICCKFRERAEILFCMRGPEGTLNPRASTEIVNAGNCDIFILVLWSQLLRRGEALQPPGSSISAEMESVLTRSDSRPKAVIYRCDRTLDVDRISAEDHWILEHHRGALDEFCQDAHARGIFVESRTYSGHLDFAERLEEYLGGQVKEILPDRGRRGSWSESPFIGLKSFEFKERGVFCGRDVAIEEAFGQLDKREDGLRSLLIVGASGSGKSSLARCGLADRLGRSLQDNLHRIELRPGDQTKGTAVEQLFQEIVPIIPNEYLQLVAERAEIVLAPGQKSPDNSGRQPFILILDQLEEIFAQEFDPQQATKFGLLVDLLVRRGLCWCVATIRSDYKDQMANFPEFSHFLNGVYYLRPPTKAEIGEMIREPAWLAGLEFESKGAPQESLADRILDDAIEASCSLPLLQFTLNELYWKRRNGTVLSFDDYDGVDRIKGCLAMCAEKCFNSLATDKRAAFSRVFRQLVRVTEDAIPAKVQCRESVFANDPSAKSLLQSLVDDRLLVRDGQTVELIHESLLEYWPMLRDWLMENQELLIKRSRLDRRWREWKEKSRPGGLLLSPEPQLREAFEVRDAGLLSPPCGADSPSNDRKSDIHAFIQASQVRAQVHQWGIKSLFVFFAVAALIFMILWGHVGNLNIELEAKTIAAEASADAARESARAAVEAQFNLVQNSLESVEGRLKELEQLAANEQSRDRLTKSLGHLYAAEKIAEDGRKSLLREVESIVTASQSNSFLSRIAEPLVQTIRERILGSQTLDPAYWRHRLAIIFREFPEITWRRRLQAKVLRSELSPDRRLLLLVTESGTEQNVIVWNLQQNQPTECCIKVPLAESPPIVSWAADGASFVVIEESSNQSMGTLQTRIRRVDPLNGEVLAGPFAHQGLVHSAASSADGKLLFVVNTYDGSRQQLSQLLNATLQSGNADSTVPLSQADAEHTATITRYELSRLQVEESKTFPGWIDDCALAGDWTAISMREPQSVTKEQDASRVCLLDSAFETELFYLDASPAGGIGLSPDGRYLAVSGKRGGFELLERVDDQLIRRAEAGVSPLGKTVVVRSRVAAPGMEPEIDVVFGETPFAMDGKRSSAQQSVVAYTYAPQTQKMRNSFAAATESEVKSIALQDNGGEFDLIAAGFANGSARVWQLSTGKPLTPSLDHVGDCQLIAFPVNSGTSDQQVLPFLSVSGGGELALWNNKGNALGEALRSTDLSRQRPIAVSDHAPANRVWQSPDEQWMVEWPKVAASGKVLLTKNNTAQLEQTAIEIGFDAEEVFWTSDSRFAVVVAGRVRAGYGQANPLYKLSVAAAFLKTAVPSTSHLAVLDLKTRTLTGPAQHFDGPMVDLQLPAGQHVCCVGFLSRKQNRGYIWRLNPHDLSHESFDLPVPEFCCFSVSADLRKAVIADRFGRPLLLEVGQPARSLPGQVGTVTGFTRCVMLDSGHAVLMEPANPTQSPVVVDLETFNAQITAHKPAPMRQRQIYSFPARDEFLVANGDSEIAIIDGITAGILKTLPLKAAVSKAVFTPDGRRLAVFLQGGLVTVLDTATWNAVAPELSWTESTTGQPDQFEFSVEGNLLVSDMVPVRMRLNTMSAAQTTKELLMLLTPRDQVLQVPCDELSESGIQLDFASHGDWYDAFATTGPLVERDPATAIQILRKFRLNDIRVNWVARRQGILQLQIAKNANDLGEWREALDFLTSESTQVRDLDANSVGPLIRELCYFSVDQAEILQTKWKNVRSPAAPESLDAIIYDISDANVLSAAGRNPDAWELHTRFLSSPKFSQVVQAKKEMIAFVLRAAFSGVQSGSSAAELLSEFDVVAGDKSPAIAITRRYFCYLSGQPTVEAVDLSIPDASLDNRILLFHRFLSELESEPASERGLRLAREMVQASSDEFRLSAWLAGPITFPVLRAHCRLFEADALLRLKRLDEARKAVQSAEVDWLAYCQQLTNLGLDPRALWVERFGYEMLKSRIETQMAAGLKRP